MIKPGWIFQYFSSVFQIRQINNQKSAWILSCRD